MISSIKFEPWHVDLIKDIKPEFTNQKFHTDCLRELKVDSNNPALTIIHGKDEILGFVSGSFIYPQVFTIFSLLSESVKKYPVAFHKEVERILSVYIETCDIKRVEMYVKASFKQAVRWAERLGFQREGLLKNYGIDCCDYYLYARYS